MKCVACEKDLPKKETVYTESKEAYCINPFTCNENHPNSPQNIVARGNAMKLFTEKELDHYQTENLDLSQIEKEKIHRIVTKPMTVRINQVPLAYYLLQVQEEYGLGSLSESIRMCVEQMSIHSPIGKPLETKKPEEEQKESKPMQFLNATPVKIESTPVKTLCAKCKKPQFMTTSGMTCENGHGGADSITEEDDMTF